MAQVSESWDSTDDWNGVMDFTERRKRQNRLAQRTFRKKKHRERMAIETRPEPMALASTVDIPRHTQMPVAASSNAIAANFALTLLVQRKASRELREKIMTFLQRVSTDWMSRFLNPTDLPTLTRLNALDALVQNALVLQIPFEFLESDDFNSPFNCYGPRTLGSPQSFPDCLEPTDLQKSVTHHSWLDLFPIPKMRDNILWGIQTGQLDEDRLCDELCCDLLNLTAETTSTLVVWGNPWEVRGWEFSADFFKAWGLLLYGCPEVLEATNYWRTKRGEKKLVLGH